MGRPWGSPVHLIFADGRVHEIRSIQRRPLLDRWNRAAVEAVCVFPWSSAGAAEQPVEISFDPVHPPEPVPQETGQMPSRVHITVEMLNTYGYQQNCPRCRAIQANRPRKGVKHSESCRTRVEHALREAQDPRQLAADARVHAE